MTVAEFIEELQEDYDPDVQVESIHMKTSDGMILLLRSNVVLRG